MCALAVHSPDSARGASSGLDSGEGLTRVYGRLWRGAGILRT